MPQNAVQRHRILLRERLRALEHGVERDGVGVRVVNRLENICPLCIQPQIRRRRMPQIVDVELSADIEVKRRERNHAPDRRNFAAERVPVHRQVAVSLHADAEWIPLLHLRCLHGHHTPDRRLDQPHAFIQQPLFLRRHLLFEHALDNLVRIHQVLADNDVQRVFRLFESPL
ncbi:hypothetical protein SDC9_115104 [bioreactor metagenome]|uniref:Uncharacterized protein n=1 Tax=bioreactor metagenome TaxID=1076179 RepID=A0A645BYI1_9ZZZZ